MGRFYFSIRSEAVNIGLQGSRRGEVSLHPVSQNAAQLIFKTRKTCGRVNKVDTLIHINEFLWAKHGWHSDCDSIWACDFMLILNLQSSDSWSISPLGADIKWFFCYLSVLVTFVGGD